MDTKLIKTLPVPYRVLHRMLLWNVGAAPRFWLGLRPVWRLLAVGQSVLEHALQTPHDRENPSTIPLYMRAKLALIARQLEEGVTLWAQEVGELREAPIWCPKCGAPGADFSDGPCPRCPAGPPKGHDGEPTPSLAELISGV